MTANSTEADTIDETKTWSTNMMSFNKSSTAQIHTTSKEMGLTTKSNVAVTLTPESNITTKMIGGTKTIEKGLKLKILYF